MRVSTQHKLIHHSKSNGEYLDETECQIHQSLKDGLIHKDTDTIFWRKAIGSNSNNGQSIGGRGSISINKCNLLFIYYPNYFILSHNGPFNVRSFY